MVTKTRSEESKKARESDVVAPERARLTAEEALKRMEAFADERKEKLVAAVRKGKD